MIASLSPSPYPAIHRYHIYVPHLLQDIGGERGPKLPGPLCMIFCKFMIFTDIDKMELLPSSCLAFTSATVHYFTHRLACSTSCKNPGLCFMSPPD